MELEHDGARLLLDLGLPLTVGLGAPEVPLPAVAGLDGSDPSLVGLVVTHGHPDHYGLVAWVGASVPVYVGKAAAALLREAAFFTPMGADIDAAGYLQDRVSVQLGPFRVTPLLVDHSAYDAYAVLVEAGGRRLLYSGDVRATGRKAEAFERLVTDPPRGVHTLMMEGTHVRPGPQRPSLTERQVEDEFVRQFQETPGAVLLAFSPQNIDRLVSAFKAARRSGRTLVLDLYAAAIARATGNPRIPQVDWDGVAVYVPVSQRVKVKQSGQFERVNEVAGERLVPEDLRGRANELVVAFRGSMVRELDAADCLDGARLVWSMWQGYLDDPSSAQLRAWLKGHDIPTTVVHASGHARVEDLQRLAAAVGPEQLVPVHTWHPELFGEVFESVDIRNEGEWFTA